MHIWTSLCNHHCWCLLKRQQKEAASFCTHIWNVSYEETWITRWGAHNLYQKIVVFLHMLQCNLTQKIQKIKHSKLSVCLERVISDYSNHGAFSYSSVFDFTSLLLCVNHYLSHLVIVSVPPEWSVSQKLSSILQYVFSFFIFSMVSLLYPIPLLFSQREVLSLMS